MKRWRNIILFSLTCIVVVPTCAALVSSKKVTTEKTIPQLECEDTSAEEQYMLDVFEVEKSTVFWQWIHRMSGALVSRYTIIRQVLRKKTQQMKGWWHGHPS